MKKFIIVLAIALINGIALQAQVPVITTQPNDTALCSSGGTATFTVAASNNPTSYNWEYSTDGGETWKVIVANTSKISFTNFKTASFQAIMIPLSVPRDSVVMMFRGSAINASGSSLPSNSVVLTALANPTKPNIYRENATPVCPNQNVQLIATPANGVWSSFSNSIATITCCGLATSKAKGNCYMSYSYEATNGCSSTALYVLAVNGLPAIPSIAYAPGTINPQIGAGGSGNFCNNKTFTVVGTPSGGVWSTTGTAITINPATGVVNTVAVGSGTLEYTISNGTCTNKRSFSGTVVLCAARGIKNEEMTNNNSISLFPNPARSIVRLQIEKLVGAGSIVVTDLYGKQVKTQLLSIGINDIDVSNLSKGFYLVTVITNEGKNTQKLIVE